MNSGATYGAINVKMVFNYAISKGVWAILLVRLRAPHPHLLTSSIVFKPLCLKGLVNSCSLLLSSTVYWCHPA